MDYVMMTYLPLYQWEVICDLSLNWTSYGYDLVLEPESKKKKYVFNLKSLKQAGFMPFAILLA
jgi:hypothetical protein